MAMLQSLTNGNVLAGWGLNNSNAPQASDNAAALGLIRENNENTRRGRDNIGLQSLIGASGVLQGINQYNQEQSQKQFQSDYASALQSGDRQQIRDLMAKYPQQVQAVQAGMKWNDDDHRAAIGDLASRGQIAAQMSPETFQSWVGNNAQALSGAGVDPNQLLSMYQQDPKGTTQLIGNFGMQALGPEEYWKAQDRIVGRGLEQSKLDEQIRSNQAGERLQSRGQDIQARGQDLSAETARRGQDMSMQRSTMRNADNDGIRDVQLADGRTVSISGKLHGAGASAFYEGVDSSGNTIRVPTSSIAAPASSAASSMNYGMKKDLDSILDANTDSLGAITGITGGIGNASIDADYRSRWAGAEQRQLYNSAQRIQGKMQNQGIAAARDMGASGINTVAEAKMYFQSMPQLDYSSPESLKKSARDIQQYTDSYNQQYNVSLGKGEAGNATPVSQSQTQTPTQSGSFTSKSGIQFTVK